MIWNAKEHDTAKSKEIYIKVCVCASISAARTIPPPSRPQFESPSRIRIHDASSSRPSGPSRALPLNPFCHACPRPALCHAPARPAVSTTHKRQADKHGGLVSRRPANQDTAAGRRGDAGLGTACVGGGNVWPVWCAGDGRCVDLVGLW